MQSISNSSVPVDIRSVRCGAKRAGNGSLRTEFSIRNSGSLGVMDGFAGRCLPTFLYRWPGRCTLVMPKPQRMHVGKESRCLPRRNFIAPLLERPTVRSGYIRGGMPIRNGSTETLIFIDGIQRGWTLILRAKAHSVLPVWWEMDGNGRQLSLARFPVL